MRLRKSPRPGYLRKPATDRVSSPGAARILGITPKYVLQKVAAGILPRPLPVARTWSIAVLSALKQGAPFVPPALPDESAIFDRDAAALLGRSANWLHYALPDLIAAGFPAPSCNGSWSRRAVALWIREHDLRPAAATLPLESVRAGNPVDRMTTPVITDASSH